MIRLPYVHRWTWIFAESGKRCADCGITLSRTSPTWEANGVPCLRPMVTRRTQD